ncbi:MAG: hypothetical protein WD645_01500, partial [Dehalococcoidia bacterium]
RPDVVFTFGPLGISRHDDHITIHKAAMEAYRRYQDATGASPRLLYSAIPKDTAETFEIDIDGPEVDPNVFVDVGEQWALKVAALRLYQSQEDAQQLAGFFEQSPWQYETFHQAHPSLPQGEAVYELWPEASPAAG